MPKFVINGQRPLAGEISVRGAKNAALKILPAALLSAEPITIKNLPRIQDVDLSIKLLEELGAEVDRGQDSATIRIETITDSRISATANKLRASVVFTGPLLARMREVRFPHPGGCVIGAGTRPIDLFLEGFAALGAEVEEADGYYSIRADKLSGGEYFFTTISVTGTETLMMAAVLAEGKTILKNCALEPEIAALAAYLNSQGAKISGAGTATIVIDGVKRISAGEFTIMPDRIEAGTFAIMAAATKAELTIRDCDPSHLEALLSIFSKIGVKFSAGKDYLTIRKSPDISSYSVKTHEYPGFPTDLQSPYTVLMTQARGSAIIHETIYDRRLLFTDMLAQMGADIIMCDPHRVVVNGPSKLYGRKLTSPDLRAGIAMIIAGLTAEGKTEIDNIYQIDRGYERIDERLRSLGADITRQDD